MPLHKAIDEKKIDIVKAFNQKHKNGVEILRKICAQNGLDDQQASEELATLFIEEKNQLNLDYVGDYLSSPDQHNQDTLKSFVAQQNFKGKSFVQSVRDYLQSFKLPGEAQKIDRLVEAFGAQYCLDNSKEFTGIKDKDAAYILAFQTIMLNSDLHKDGVVNKMTLEQLKKNVRGCNDKEDFPESLLENLYKDIKEKPFELNFVETVPGYNLKDSNLSNDPAFKEITKVLKGYKVNGNLIQDSMEVKVDHPKNWLNKLTGYQGDVTIKNKETGARATVQVYEPSIFSRWFLGEKAKLIIQPGDGKDQLDKKNIDFAAQLTAGFKTVQVKEQDIEATYHYAKEDLATTYIAAKGKEEGKFASIIPDVARNELMNKLGQSLKSINKDDQAPSQPTLKRSDAFRRKSGDTRFRGV
ncbi:MAG: hypothetical protein LF885_07310 (plasmid) [Rickettsia endosymbiont of Culicoides impunctatus]|nr:MAG: hypothetical protein LF885_07310 [Rickettsia endosymbiont of Culicoides impunctatus]